MVDPDATPATPEPERPQPKPPAPKRVGLAALAAGAGLLLLAILWLLFGGGGAPEPQQRPPYVLPVRLATVIQGDVAPRVELTGTVRAIRRANLAFTVAGLVSETCVREADRVAAGQVLATLDSGDQLLSLAERRAELDLAERTLAKLEAGPRDEEKARLVAELAVARAEQELARIEVERSQTLLEQKIVSTADRDRQRAAFAAARGRADAAQARLDEAQAGSRLEDVQVARARVAQARAALQAAERELAKTQLRAPWAGVVVARQVASGRVVSAGQPIYELVDPDHLELEVQIPSRYVPRLGDRARAELTTDELPDLRLDVEFDAQIPVADPLSRNFAAVAQIPAPAKGSPQHELLRPGMFVRLRVQLAPLRDQLVVPTDAVRVTVKGPVVVVAVPGPEGPDGKPSLRAEWVSVRTLGSDARGTAVRPAEGTSLAAGAQVVTTGVDIAFPGAPLLPRPEPPAGEPGAGRPAADRSAE